MNAPTPSPSSSSVPLAKPIRSRAWPAFVRPVLSCGGALLLGGALVHLFSPARASSSAVEEVTVPTLMVVPASQMMTARLAPLAPRTLRGEFHFTTDATGRAPVTGAVARQLVGVGAHVEAGDRVLEVSSGAISRPAPVAEKKQYRVVREQVDVAKGQSALAGQLTGAQNQLVAAQERVARAQEHVASTRSLVKRLLAGEQIPATGEFAASSRPLKRIRKRRRRVRLSVPSSSTRAGQRAEAGVQSAEAAVQSAKSGLSSAQSERNDARAAVASAQKKVDSSKAALEKAEADFKTEKTTADVLQSARADADDAAGALKTAQARADTADQALASRQNKVDTAETLAASSREEAKRAQTRQPDPAQTRQPDPVEDAPTPTDEPPSDARFLSADQAATMVASALQESKSATRTADRMRALVENYQRQVKSTSNRSEKVTQELQVVQQEVLDTTPRPVFTTTRAPRSGTITWVSRLAREVSQGQAVFGISQGHSGFLRFEDKGTAWKALKVGQTLNAAPTPTPIQSNTTQPLALTSAKTSTNSVTSGAAPSGAAPSGAAPSGVAPSGAAPSGVAPSGVAPSGVLTSGVSTLLTPPEQIALGTGGGVFTVRVTRITAPQSEGGTAQIDAVRLDEAGSPAEVSAVQMELPAEAVPAQQQASSGMAASAARPVVVPASVVLPRDGVNYVAVMSASAPVSSGAQPGLTKTVTLLWRPVQVARQTAFDVELRGGVRDGEELVNQPALLLSQWKPEDKKPFPVSLDASG